MKFLKNVLASFVAICLAVFIFILIGVGIAVSVSKDTVKPVVANSVLEIDLSGSMKDYSPTELDPVAEVFGFEEKEYGFNNVCKAIAFAKKDSKIKGISIREIPNNIGWSQITTLRKMLTEFKKTGKFIYAYNNVYSQRAYYLNSVADSLFTSPLGRVELKGLHSEVSFYKSFQEKYGVKMEVIRHGKYKSAVEPYIADEMSDSNREQITALIKSLWSEVHTAITTSRNIDVDKAVLELHGLSATTSLKNNLIDAVVYEDRYEDVLKDKLGTEKLQKVKLSNYMTTVVLNDVKATSNSIAVVYAEGNIVDGKGEKNTIADKKMVKTLYKAADRKDVKAIVLRINSPGGSALASDLIWRAIEKVKEKKPVIVSMANVAASGGYYIAAGADRIFAEPTTITGSIGVFGMLPNAAALASKIGIHTEVVSSHDNGMHYSVTKPVDTRFKKAVKSGIENVYSTFLQRVASGRKLSIAQVDAIAQGRVWTGKKAIEIGLVDELGDLEMAIAYAARKVGLQNYGLVELPDFKLDLKGMLNPTSFLKAELGFEKVIKETGFSKLLSIQNVFKTKGVQARIPFELEIN